jgi:hypothetical protein
MCVCDVNKVIIESVSQVMIVFYRFTFNSLGQFIFGDSSICFSFYYIPPGFSLVFGTLNKVVEVMPFGHLDDFR